MWILTGCGGGGDGGAEVTLRPIDWVVPPGWLATFGEGDESPHRVVTPVAGFALGDSTETYYPPVRGTDLDVTFRGELNLESSGEYRFGAEVEGGTCDIEVVSMSLGRETLTIGPEESGTLTEPLRLEAGKVILRYRFRRDGDAKARLRALWAKEGAGASGFRPEPIPATAVRVPEDREDGAREAFATRRGMQLLGELGCVNCHDPGEGEELILRRQGPDLAEVGDRASEGWLRKWLASPRMIKSHAVMPELFYGDEGDEADLNALVAYLGSLGGTSSGETGWDKPGSTGRGETLYGEVGCIACHGTVSGAGDPPWALGSLRGKWTHATLAKFLHDPASLRPHGRMPGMDLDESESRDIAAYMLKEWGGAATPASAAASPSDDLVTRGREVFIAKGCVSCHAVAGQPPESQRLSVAMPVAELRVGRGCLDPEDRTTPRYDLDRSDADALTLALLTLQGVDFAAPARRYAAGMRIEPFG